MPGLSPSLEKKKTSLPKWLAAAASLFLVVALAILDQMDNHYLSLLIFYLLPMCAATWYVGRWLGIVELAMSAAAWAVDDIVATHSYLRPALPYWDLGLKVIFCAGAIYAVWKLRRSLDMERQYSRTDFLTRISNRQYFFEAARVELSRAQRYQRPLTLAYIDIDDFKAVNDRLGHKAGDEMLMAVARALRDGLRTTDTVARVGGDEFVVMFPETSFSQAEGVVERLRQSLARAMAGQKMPATFSIGVVSCSSKECNFDSLMSLSDSLMYEAKKKGKDTVVRKELCNAPDCQA